MLTTETFTLGEAVDELGEQITALEEAAEEYDDDTDEAEALQARKSKLSYWRKGLQWHLNDGTENSENYPEWTKETTIELGAMKAGQEAMLNREMPTVEDEDEYRLWWVTGSTLEAPYATPDAEGVFEVDLRATFADLSDLHPAVPKYLEAKANSLGIASDEGNESAASSGATTTSETPTTPSDSTT